MSSVNILNKDQKRQSILEREIAALLHLLGKTNKRYLESIVNNETVDDKNLNHIETQDLICDSTLEKLAEKKGFECLTICHRKAGAEEKGACDNTQADCLMSPFGKNSRELFRNILNDQAFWDDGIGEEINSILSELDSGDLEKSKSARKRLIDGICQERMSRIPGESRRPANDLSVWDQSLAVAALYKAMVAKSIISGEKISCETESQVRLLIIRLNRRVYLSGSTKVQDLLQKQENLNTIADGIKDLIECDIPTGNLVLRKNEKGWLWLVFTFPHIKEKIRGIAKNTAVVYTVESVVEQYKEKIRGIAKDTDVLLGYELPIDIGYTDPRRLASECLSDISNFSKTTRVISSIEHKGETNTSSNGMKKKSSSHICPVCHLEILAKKSDSMCSKCKKRVVGRFSRWMEKRDSDTIWTSELADANNKIALLTVSIDANMWLSGEWFSSICTKDKEKSEVLKECAKILGRTPKDVAEAAKSLEKFLPGVKVRSKNIDRHIDNLAEWFDKSKENITKDLFATRIATINPSIGRLMRVMKELETFINETVKKCRHKLPGERCLIKTNLDSASKGELYSTTLGKRTLQLVYVGNGYLAVIERIDEKETELIRNKGELDIVSEESDNATKIKQLPGGFKEEPFSRMISLAESPTLFQILLPADKIPDITTILDDLYKEYFYFVQGKLPLNISIAVAKRKFPLYSLLEAGERMTDSMHYHRIGKAMSPWWEMDQRSNADNHKYYKYYPTSGPGNDPAIFKYSDLEEVSANHSFWLTPGLTDFVYLSSTSDVDKVSHYKNSDSVAVGVARNASSIGWLGLLPVYTHQYFKLMSLYGKCIDKNRNGDDGTNSITALRNLERILHEKLLSLNNITDDEKEAREKAFESFFKATLKNFTKIAEDDIPGNTTLEKVRILLNMLHFYLHVIG